MSKDALGLRLKIPATPLCLILRSKCQMSTTRKMPTSFSAAVTAPQNASHLLRIKTKMCKFRGRCACMLCLALLIFLLVMHWHPMCRLFHLYNTKGYCHCDKKLVCRLRQSFTVLTLRASRYLSDRGWRVDRAFPEKGRLPFPPFSGNRISGANFVIVLYSNYGSILFRFRDITAARRTTDDGRTDGVKLQRIIWSLRRTGN